MSVARPADGESGERGRIWVLAACGALALVRLWLTVGDGVTAVPYNGFDDGLFVNLAQHLAAGRWLGPYNEMTLIKGPFYPMWVAAAFRSGIPLLLAQHLLYVAACALGVLALHPLLADRRAGLVAFAVLLFNPLSFAPDLADRVLRVGIYPALTMLVIACGVGVVARQERTPARLAPWCIGLGLSFSAFWLTREEGVWLLPVAGLLLAWSVARILRGRDAADTRSSRVVKVVLCVLPVTLWGVAVAGVSRVNKARYGIAAVTEIQATPFTAAYGALVRANDGRGPAQVPVPADTRARVYRVSPAFSDLKPYLEGDVGHRWAAYGCEAGLPCDDIGGGWFMWAFRQAAARAGHHTSGPEASRYYGRVAAEVNAACADGRLVCGRPRATLHPPLRADLAGPTVVAAGRVAVALAGFRETKQRTSPTYVSPAAQARFQTITRDHSPPPKEYLSVEALGVSSRGPVEVVVRGPDGAAIPATLTRLPTPQLYRQALDLGMDNPHLREARIRVETPCITGCRLEARAGGVVFGRVPVHAGDPPLVTRDGGFQVVSTRHIAVRPPEDTPFGIVRRAARRALAALYGLGMPPLAALALGAWAVRTVGHLRQRRLPTLWVVQSTLLLAVLLRVGLLALIDVTSFPATGTRFLAPAHPILLLFTVLAGADMVRAWRERRPSAV